MKKDKRPQEIEISFDSNADKNIAKLVDWNNPPKLKDLKTDFKDACPTHNLHKAKVNEYLDVLDGRLKIKTKEGRSTIQPRVVRKQAEWLYASLEYAFLSSPDIYDINPATHLDVEAARQNAIVINKQFRTDIPRVALVNKFTRTAVNTGTVIVKLSWESESYTSRVEVEVPIYAQTDEEAMTFIQELLQTGQLDEMSAQALLASGEPIQIGTSIEEEDQEIRTINRPVVEIKDSRNIIIDPTCEGEIEKANFLIDMFVTDLSTLKKDGRYKNLDKIKPSDMSMVAEDIVYHEDFKNSNTFEFKDEPRKKFIAYEYWGYWDINGDGMVKPIVATWVGNVMIRLEENPYPDKQIPYVITQFLPPSSNSAIYGEALAELLKDNQDILGAVTRGITDILGCSANGQRAIAKGMLDPINQKKFNEGEDFMFTPLMPFSEGYHMTKYSDIPNSAFDMIMFQNNEAEAQSGVKAFSQGITSEALGNSVGGIKSALDVTAKRELGILRRFSEGFQKIGRKIISMNSVFLSDEEIIRIADEDVKIKRDDLAGNFDLVLTISTAEEDNQAASNLAFLLQTVGNTFPLEFTQMILSRMVELYKQPDLAEAIRQYKPQPDPYIQEMQALELEHKRVQIENERAKAVENNADVGLKQAKTQQALADANLKATMKDKGDLEYVNDVTGTSHARKLAELEANKADTPKPSNNNRI